MQTGMQSLPPYIISFILKNSRSRKVPPATAVKYIRSNPLVYAFRIILLVTFAPDKLSVITVGTYSMSVSISPHIFSRRRNKYMPGICRKCDARFESDLLRRNAFSCRPQGFIHRFCVWISFSSTEETKMLLEPSPALDFAFHLLVHFSLSFRLGFSGSLQAVFKRMISSFENPRRRSHSSVRKPFRIRRSISWLSPSGICGSACGLVCHSFLSQVPLFPFCPAYWSA